MRIHGERNNLYLDTKAVEVVYDQWINYQFTIDRVVGYEIRVYDIFGNLKDT